MKRELMKEVEKREREVVIKGERGSRGRRLGVYGRGESGREQSCILCCHTGWGIQS
jgi:hypothetical protein